MAITKFLCLPLLLVSFLTIAGTEKIYDPSRNALSDYQYSLKAASLNNKNIFIIAGGNWCSFCYKFDKYLKESSLDKVIENDFILMKVNFGDGNYNEGFFSLFPEFNTYPHIMIISSDGRLLESINVPSKEESLRALITKYTINKNANNITSG